MHRKNKLALLGFILVLPALLLVTGGLAQSVLGTTHINDLLNFKLPFFHPVVIIGGLMLAFVLNLLPLLRINFQDGLLTSTLTLRDKYLNLGLIGGIGLLFTIIFLYLLAENLQIFQVIF